MTPQVQFDITLDLLRRKGSKFPFASGLIDNYKSMELTFDCFGEPSSGTTKTNLLGIYQVRANIEQDRKDNFHVSGYDSLIPNLQQTNLTYICISTFSTNIGSFIVFSDFDRQDLIGVLFSKTTLRETRDKMNEHKKLVEFSGKTVLHDYTQNEQIFINGQFQTQNYI